MYAIVQNGQILQTIRPHTAFTFDGREYNDRWTTRMSEQDKAALGIMEVAYGPRQDERFYWVSDNPLTLIDGVPTQTFSASEKLLEDRAEVDEQGSPLFVQVFDPTANEGQGGMVNSADRLITTGLKTQWITQIKATANSMLSATDWKVVRAAEGVKAVDQDTLDSRAAIRAYSDTLEANIQAAATMEAFIAVVTNQQWPAGGQ